MSAYILRSSPKNNVISKIINKHWEVEYLTDYQSKRISKTKFLESRWISVLETKFDLLG